MDNLARNAMLARQANMSYGKWKAMQQTVRVEKKAVPDGWIVCEWCKKPFKPKTKRPQKYCDAGCQKQAYYEKNRQKSAGRMRERRARKLDLSKP